MRWSLTNTCGVTQNFKFFDDKNNWVWPNSSSHYTLSAGRTDTFPITCRTGANVCAGGGSNSDGSEPQWGVGLKNNKGCSDCCYACVSGPVQPRQIVCTTTAAQMLPLVSTK